MGNSFPNGAPQFASMIFQAHLEVVDVRVGSTADHTASCLMSLLSGVEQTKTLQKQTSALERLLCL